MYRGSVIVVTPSITPRPSCQPKSTRVCTCCSNHCAATIVSSPIHSLISVNCNRGGPSFPSSLSGGISMTCRIARYRSQVYANLGFVNNSFESLLFESGFTHGYQAIHPESILPSGLARFGRATRNCVCANGIIETITSYHQLPTT